MRLRVNVKRETRRLVGEQLWGPLWGSLEYYLFLKRAQGGPFNGQKMRIALFDALIERLTPVAIVETGTYVGTTTELFAKSGLPVYSVESNPRAYDFARTRLRTWRNVNLLRGDSRDALRQWFDGPLRSLKRRSMFFYLDAHWESDLPLAEELEIIFAQSPAAVVMIDDFQVPGDSGYSHDDFGPGKELTFKYIAGVVNSFGLGCYYPATPSEEESGGRRGCVVLIGRAIDGAAFGSFPLKRLLAQRTEGLGSLLSMSQYH